MAEKKVPQDNMINRENVVVDTTKPHGGDVPPVGHIHEERDVPIGALLRATAYLVVGIVLAAVAMWGLFEFLAARADATDPAVSPMAERRLPPQPRLQSNPGRDMAAFLARQDSAVMARSVDTNGAVVIPVEEAMDLIAKHGLPRFKATTADSTRTAASGATTGGPAGTAPAGTPSAVPPAPPAAR